MVSTFAVAHINICVKWMLIVSYVARTEKKFHVAANSTKTAVRTGFWKLCTAVLHVDTE